MKKLIFAFGFLLPISLLSFMIGTIWAHGVVYEVKEDKTVMIKVNYDDDEPMGYAEVEIFSPSDGKIEYQNGRTDKNGCFAFLPNEIGEWKIKVNDGMGHGVTAKIKVEEGMHIESVRYSGLARWQKLIMGLSIIFGVTGFVFYFRVRKEINK